MHPQLDQLQPLLQDAAASNPEADRCLSSGGYAASSSGCVTRPKAREIGSTEYAGPTQHSLLIGRYVMATAEHREPCDSRGSCTVLGAPGGEIPLGDSTTAKI